MGTNDEKITYILRALAMITTVIPLKTMESFHKALLPYTRMRRSTIKRVFVSFLGPICQMQQVILGIAFKTFETRSGVEYRYEWVEWYGMVMCLEMLVSSIFTIYAFN